VASSEVLLRVTLDDIRPALDALEAEFRQVCAERDQWKIEAQSRRERKAFCESLEAENDRLRMTIETVLEELEQPGSGWLDVAIVEMLKKALKGP
jgi:hypothetical protein